MGSHNSKIHVRECDDHITRTAISMSTGGIKGIESYDYKGMLEDYEEKFKACLGLYRKDRLFPEQIKWFEKSLQLIKDYRITRDFKEMVK